MRVGEKMEKERVTVWGSFKWHELLNGFIIVDWEGKHFYIEVEWLPFIQFSFED